MLNKQLVGGGTYFRGTGKERILGLTRYNARKEGFGQIHYINLSGALPMQNLY